jgi:hypothetical protein
LPEKNLFAGALPVTGDLEQDRRFKRGHSTQSGWNQFHHSLNPSASVSGGPNFSVANLNTQEFYQGIQSPISAQVVANYAAAGGPARLTRATHP